MKTGRILLDFISPAWYNGAVMNEVELTVKVTTEQLYQILSELSDIDTVKLVKRLIPDLSDVYIDELERFIESL